MVQPISYLYEIKASEVGSSTSSEFLMNSCHTIQNHIQEDCILYVNSSFSHWQIILHICVRLHIHIYNENVATWNTGKNHIKCRTGSQNL
jgi:hypothetical protein